MKFQDRRTRVLTALLCLFCCLSLCVNAAADAGIGREGPGEGVSLASTETSEAPETSESTDASQDPAHPPDGGDGAEETPSEPVESSEDPEASESSEGMDPSRDPALTPDGGPDGGSSEGSAATDALQVNGVEAAEETVLVSLSGDTVALTEQEATYTLSLGNMDQLATVTLWLEVDSDYLVEKKAQPLGGFKLLDGVYWEESDGSLRSGRMTLVHTDGGATSSSYADVLRLTFSTGAKPGETDVILTRIELSGYNADGIAVFYEADMEADAVRTEVLSPNPEYDINRDGKVDQLDLTLAQFYYTAKEVDENWDEARIADVNEDGRVDIEDLILILNHIDWEDRPDGEDPDASGSRAMTLAAAAEAEASEESKVPEIPVSKAPDEDQGTDETEASGEAEVPDEASAEGSVAPPDDEADQAVG